MVEQGFKLKQSGLRVRVPNSRGSGNICWVNQQKRRGQKGQRRSQEECYKDSSNPYNFAEDLNGHKVLSNETLLKLHDHSMRYIFWSFLLRGDKVCPQVTWLVSGDVSWALSNAPQRQEWQTQLEVPRKVSQGKRHWAVPLREPAGF